MKNKGFTLIELVITMSIVSILIIIEFQYFEFFTKLYNKDIAYSRDILNIKEAIFYIEKEINDETQYVEIDTDNSIIKIYKFTGIDINADIMENITYYAQIEYIKLLNNKLVVLYGNSSSKPKDNSYKNTLLEDVISFTVTQNKKLIYIEIQDVRGVRVKKCLVVKNVR